MTYSSVIPISLLARDHATGPIGVYAEGQIAVVTVAPLLAATLDGLTVAAAATGPACPQTVHRSFRPGVVMNAPPEQEAAELALNRWHGLLGAGQ